MRLTFEKAVQKYEASMLRRAFSKKTIRSRKVFFVTFAEWLSKNHQGAFQDMRAVTCEIMKIILILRSTGLKAWYCEALRVIPQGTLRVFVQK